MTIAHFAGPSFQTIHPMHCMLDIARSMDIIGSALNALRTLKTSSNGTLTARPNEAMHVRTGNYLLTRARSFNWRHDLARC
jgi:hypothetical protein